jgi:oligoribonuclease (3'-5' exoribonuclease)
VLDAYVKKNMHQALEDIRESIRELQIYRDLFFNLDS